MVPVCTAMPAVSVTKKVLVGVNSSVRDINEARLGRREYVPFHPENKPFSARKRAHCVQETRHRKHLRTRTIKTSRPLRN